MLMTHSHSLGNVKEEFLAELSHIPLALLAVAAGWWDGWKSGSRPTRYGLQRRSGPSVWSSSASSWFCIERADSNSCPSAFDSHLDGAPSRVLSEVVG